MNEMNLYKEIKQTTDLNLNEEESIELFLAQFESPFTKRTYKAAFKRFTDWCKQNDIKFASLTPTIADAWIAYEKQSGRAPASVRKDVATMSSFYTFLEKNYALMVNPFRGTKARPENKASKKIEVPDDKDFYTIIENVPPELSVIVQLMGFTGLSAGAFENLSFHDNIMQSVSKGKEIKQLVPNDVIRIIEKAGLNKTHPFSSWKAYRIENLLHYYTEKLHSEGMIKSAYSAHDFRHYFAVCEYSKNRNIYELSKLLNHSSLVITQNYLKTLNIED